MKKETLSCIKFNLMFILSAKNENVNGKKEESGTKGVLIPEFMFLNGRDQPIDPCFSKVICHYKKRG